MINQRYGVPVIVAAALHGALFLVTSNPPVPIDPIPEDPPLTPIPLTQDPIDPRDFDPPDPSAASGGPRALPTTIEVPDVTVKNADFTVPVITTSPQIDVSPKLDKIPPMAIGGPGGDGTGIGPGNFRGVVGFDKLDRNPRAIAQPSPDYPHSMRTDGVGGSVIVEFVVDTTGRVLNAEAVKWTHREFVDPAVRAVMRWRFEPGTVEGRKVRFRMAVPMEFNPT